MPRKPSRRWDRLTYPFTLALVTLAGLFPIALMVTNPTLMFDRGWEQYAGTTFYLLAVALLGREVLRLWADDRAFENADGWLDRPDAVPETERRVLPARIRGLTRSNLPLAQLVELNREASSLDQEHAAGHFTLPRYILYLLPVIGFIGTVEGISKALMNISKVLPMVKELDGFLTNLGGVTHALNIAFDSTLLALFLSAALMLVQTLVQHRAGDLLTRVDRWVVEHVLPRAAVAEGPSAETSMDLRDQLARLETVLATLNESIAPHLDRFAQAVDRLPAATKDLEKGAAGFGRLGEDLRALSAIGDPVRKGVATLGRIESALANASEPDDQLDQIRRAVDRSNQATEALAGQLSSVFERNSRTTQEQLARTLGSLKDALDLLNVSMEQGNALYRSIVKKMFPIHAAGSEELAA